MLVRLLFLWFALSVNWLSAQSAMQEDYRLRQFEYELFLRSAGNHSAQVTKAAIAQQQADQLRIEFWTKANRFVELWSRFTQEMKERQTVNVKLARKVSKAFHDLEKSSGWPAIGKN